MTAKLSMVNPKRSRQPVYAEVPSQINASKHLINNIDFPSNLAYFRVHTVQPTSKLHLHMTPVYSDQKEKEID